MPCFGLGTINESIILAGFYAGYELVCHIKSAQAIIALRLLREKPVLLRESFFYFLQLYLFCRVVCIIVKNSYDGQVHREKDGFASNKHPGESCGLESVRTTVARYHGSMTVNTEEGVFRVNLLMNLSVNGENK